MRHFLLILSFAFTFSCVTTTPMQLTTQQVQKKSIEKEIDLIGETLDLTLQDGTRTRIKVVGVTANSLVSDTAEYRFDQILAIGSREFDLVKTTGVTAGTIGALILLWAISFY